MSKIIDLSTVRWVKSSYSNNGGNCIEIGADVSAAHVPVRDSKDPQGPALVVSRAAFNTFVEAVKDGRFGNA
ncbi:DUF397 domain-containing protein [Kitasatospora sp. NPDC059795]|uniref:DUF397 domain-containing protein n=1 Tax=Kitasatospora sp. NPDC059795 TaxID=3346949 RepID=UPI0036603909